MTSDGDGVQHGAFRCGGLRSCGVTWRDGACLDPWCLAIVAKANGAYGAVDLAAFDGDIVRKDLQLCHLAFVVCAAFAVDGGGALQLDSFVADLRRLAAGKKQRDQGDGAEDAHARVTVRRMRLHWRCV